MSITTQNSSKEFKDEEEVSECELNIQEYLSKYNVAEKVFTLLQQESITVNELLTFTNQDLERWCDEHKLKTIERRRFINAIKALPNAETANKPEIVKMFLGDEEKEQLKQFDEMKSNINAMIDIVGKIKEKQETSINDVIKDINKLCDDICIEKLAQEMRKDLLEHVCVFAVYVYNIF